MNREPIAAEYAAKINELTQAYIEQVEELYHQYQQNYQSLKTTEGQVGDGAGNLTGTDAAPPNGLSH